MVILCCCFYSVTQSCPTVFDPMNWSMPGFPVLHYLPVFAQTHVHWVSDAVQISHALLTPFSCPQPFPASGSFPVSRLLASGNQSSGPSASASVLPMNCCFSVAQSWPTLCDPWTAARQASLSFTTSQSLLKLMSCGLVMPSNHLGCGCPQPRGHPLSSPSPPAFNPAQHQDLFQRVSSSHWVATVLEL